LAGIDNERGITDAAVERLADCAWPGNIRQLRNFLWRLTVESAAPVLDLDAVAAIVAQAPRPTSRDMTLHAQHRERILATYVECSRNVSRAARQLGVSRNTIYRALADEDKRP
jgi:sigma-54 dependent transcriptional regulator, acetoin dehydrogenase operon transcriptional activator AcoR